MAVRTLESAYARAPVDPDAELVAAARRDAGAFLALYDRYIDRVLGYVRLRIADADTREDVTSQVFTTALERLPQFRGDGVFAGWLFQIARNAVNDVHRRAPVDSLPPVELTLVDPAAGPDEQVLREQRLQRLRTLVQTLPADHQHLLALRYGAELGFGQIAPILGATPGALRVRLHRLLQDLRRRYPDDER
jgi:RNA polymerase sigma-70 factor (ECF subfamily)